MPIKGSQLENDIRHANVEYLSLNLADISKKEVGKSFKKGFAVHLSKENFDFSGTLNSGIAVGIEAKENIKTSLPVLKPEQKGDGLKHHQMQALLRWGSWGCVVGCVWRMVKLDEAYMLDYEFLKNFNEVTYLERKSISQKEVIANCKKIKYINQKLDYLEMLGDYE
jgi:penicillin-binding protein-related factor A (putative recombinase)